ncbi:MAG: multidrug MFS transporter [Candidatus Colwellbacteria bacterium CG10_big_fil_rev_8_21_14_0_10_42_22]|uniref:Multidrug MFS transporter n=1 Tax=Candidatus Colwellbacteria bacterium CG10_big_fil_rev_8_21_14_0_10_42_22 TaxID=1974540 RepID=A0A2H0VFQ7_9BACT|nr:MAG: multidrug MFS transporter [Candidatus Colwellbacteria bacterium CG10_big_fil_rev_8_21_14_0_10_42_22]
MKYPLWKRFFDITGAVLGLLIFLPLFPLIALAIKLDSEGPVFVRLKRVSEGREIMVYKFRSMIKNAEEQKVRLAHLNERNDGPLFKIRKDPRVTRVGRFIRRIRIDESPQLVNVLRGELGLVGPRPREPEEARQYPREYKKIIDFRNGVTGYSQVNGASSLPFIKELELDKYYVENFSFWLDLKIVLKTIVILFFDPTAV